MITITPSVSNYSSFDFFNSKFDHSFYSKIYTKHHFFCGLLYQYKFFKNDLNLTIFMQIFWIRRVVKLNVKRIKPPIIIWNGGSTMYGVPVLTWCKGVSARLCPNGIEWSSQWRCRCCIAETRSNHCEDIVRFTLQCLS